MQKSGWERRSGEGSWMAGDLVPARHYSKFL